MKKKIIFLIFFGVLMALLMTTLIALWPAPKKTATSPATANTITGKISQPAEWILVWEKYPGYVGKSSQKTGRVKAIILKRTTDTLIIKTVSNIAEGLMEGYSSDGKTYAGVWKEAGDWGRWQFTFITPATASGWIDEESQSAQDPRKRAHCALALATH
ncbi:hypothetical protein KKB69_00575 [Patescibacteria group bacterium]|nr:hypothetical protein [Patescibacteria group bacterium]